MALIIDKLNPNEYAPFYKGYLAKLEDQDIVSMMIEDLEQQIQILEQLPEDKLQYSYAEGKWTVAELLTHLADSETVLAYRALTFSRMDNTNLPGFEQDDWVNNSNSDKLTKNQVVGYFKTTRNHTIALYKSFNSEQLLPIGKANNSGLSVRALAYIIIGHNRHHFSILKNRYLS